MYRWTPIISIQAWRGLMDASFPFLRWRGYDEDYDDEEEKATAGYTICIAFFNPPCTSATLRPPYTYLHEKRISCCGEGGYLVLPQICKIDRGPICRVERVEASILRIASEKRSAVFHIPPIGPIFLRLYKRYNVVKMWNGTEEINLPIAPWKSTSG